MLDSLVIFIFAVFIASVSQILLKKSANIERNNILKEYINLHVILAYILFVFSLLLTVYSYRVIDLKYGAVIQSLGYVFVLILSRIFLNEKLEKSKIFGITLIILGIIIFNM